MGMGRLFWSGGGGGGKQDAWHNEGKSSPLGIEFSPEFSCFSLHLTPARDHIPQSRVGGDRQRGLSSYSKTLPPGAGQEGGGRRAEWGGMEKPACTKPRPSRFCWVHFSPGKADGDTQRGRAAWAPLACLSLRVCRRAAPFGPDSGLQGTAGFARGLSGRLSSGLGAREAALSWNGKVAAVPRSAAKRPGMGPRLVRQGPWPGRLSSPSGPAPQPTRPRAPSLS